MKSYRFVAVAATLAIIAGAFVIFGTDVAWAASGVSGVLLANAPALPGVDAKAIKDTIDGFMKAWDEYKTTNDERLKQIEAKGAADPAVTEKLAKIEASMAKGDVLNAKFTEFEQAQKAAKTKDEEQQKEIDELNLKLQRVGLGGEQATAAQKKSYWDSWCRGVVHAHLIGVPNLGDDQRKALEQSAAEHKALANTPDTAGGYLAPVEYVREIIKGETEISPVRSLVRVRTTSQRSIQIPKRTGQFAAVWVAEQGTRSETTGLTYGLEEIPTHEVYALIDISQQNLEDSAFDMEAEIREESVEQFSVAEGAAVVSGATPGKPEGFMTNSSVGETVSGAAAAITADGMLTLKHAIKTAYTRNASWVMNRTTLGSVRKLKDGSGAYIWQPGLAVGKPNSIDGDPYVELPDMPSEGAGLYPVAYGDFRRAYALVDRIVMQMLRDPYTQATSGNIRFIMRRRIGGQVTLAEAIRKLKCSV